VQSLVLGTAQWGNPYGVTNVEGRLSDSALAQIVDVAETSGITRIDTAAAYGDAQRRLRPWAERFTITTKVTGAGPVSAADQLDANLADLGVDRCDSCLLHDWPTLTDAEAVAATAGLRALQEGGRITGFGVSAYDDADLRRALEVMGTVEVVQVPINALDRRLSHSAALRELVAAGTRVQARSVFLQGLLAARSDAALGAHPDVVRFHDRCAEEGRAPVIEALSYVRSLPWVSDVVVGVTSADELSEIVEAWSLAVEGKSWDDVESMDLGLIDPRQWA
jgi:aryl-alcohol dehydrogenase-like predicted oxidoreductase